MATKYTMPTVQDGVQQHAWDPKTSSSKKVIFTSSKNVDSTTRLYEILVGSQET